jgi:hypothetical protein
MSLFQRLLPRVLPGLFGLPLASMRGNLSFLASDALEGRGTPSRGLDIAAEFIASQFRAVGLEPPGDDAYLQTADPNLIDPKRAKNPPASPTAPVKVRNVAGILRGPDPLLKDSYVLVTAHYDHVGLKPGQGDGIFNGANDDGSGTVSVIELARAFGENKTRPKRSIVFMTVFGEDTAWSVRATTAPIPWCRSRRRSPASTWNSSDAPTTTKARKCVLSGSPASISRMSAPS